MTEAIAISIGFVVMFAAGLGLWIGGAMMRSLGWVPPGTPGAEPGERFGWEVDPEGGRETPLPASATEQRQGPEPLA